MYYHFRQNNSGGSFHFDDRGITINVIVEAESERVAIARAEDIGLYFDGCEKGMDCDCCGDRWSVPWGEPDAVPSVYGVPLAEITLESWQLPWSKDGRETAVHFADGRVEWFDVGGKPCVAVATGNT